MDVTSPAETAALQPIELQPLGKASPVISTWAPVNLPRARRLWTAALAGACHGLLEETAWPATFGQWLAVIGLGIGPVGLAFYAWDFGVKRGDIRVLGAASYAAPVLSTLLLVAAGFAEASLSLVLAAALITGGGVLAAKDMILKG